jgi:hypothetical protein
LWSPLLGITFWYFYKLCCRVPSYASVSYTHTWGWKFSLLLLTLHFVISNLSCVNFCRLEFRIFSVPLSYVWDWVFGEDVKPLIYTLVWEGFLKINKSLGLLKILQKNKLKWLINWFHFILSLSLSLSLSWCLMLDACLLSDSFDLISFLLPWKCVFFLFSLDNLMRLSSVFVILLICFSCYKYFV